MPKVSIVVPAHNEEDNIFPLLDEILPVLEQYPETEDFELVFVNDNSTDRTSEIIDKLAEQNPRIKAVHRSGTSGFGNAIKEGFRNASGDIIIPVMCDLSDDPHDIPKLVKKIDEGYDIAYGSRFIKGGTTKDYPKMKMFANRLFNNTVRLLFGVKHKDITNAFKAYRKEVLDSIGIDNLKAEGFDLTVEVPLKAHIMGFRSAEVPTTWYGRKRGIAKLKLSENGTTYGRRLLKLFFIGNLISLRDMFGAVVSGSKWKLVAAMVFGILLLIGVFSMSDSTEVFKNLINASWYYMLIGFLAISSAFFMRTWRWNILLRTSGFVVPKDIVFKSLMFGFFLNTLIPARLGDIARGSALKATEKIPMGISLTTIVIERAMDMLSLAFLLGMGTMLVSKTNSVILSAVAFGVALMLVLVLLFAYKYDDLFTGLLGKKFPAITGFMSTMKEGLYKLYGNPSAMILSVMISVPIWLLEISGIYIAALAIGYEISFSLATVAGITSFLAQTIPVTPAGIGVYEGTMVGVLSMFEIPVSKAMSLTLVDHFVRVSVIFIFGMISTIHLGFASRSYFVEKKKRSVNINENT